MDYLIEILKQHGAIGAAVLFIAYMGQRHMKSDRVVHHDVETRVRALEAERATKDDITRVHDRLDDLHTEMSAGQREILLAIRDK